MKVTDKTIVALSITGIVILQAIALIKGVDGTLYGMSIAAIAGLGGYAIRTFIIK